MDLFCVRCQFIFMFLVYPGQPGTVLQSGQPAYMYQTAGTNPTPYPVQTSPMMGQINQSIGESPPPAYQVHACFVIMGISSRQYLFDIRYDLFQQHIT